MRSGTYLIVAVIVFCFIAVDNVASRAARTPVSETLVRNPRTLLMINGHEVNRGKWPWQVYLDCVRCSSFCGGSLVHREWVLTAAHCAKDVSISRDEVYLGAHNVNIHEASQQRIGIASTHLHPQYNSSTEAYDVALLKLRTPATINNDVKLVTLIAKNQGIAAGKRCKATGWGTAEQESSVLRQADVRIFSHQDCLRYWEDMGPEGLCAGGRGQGICNGDSGGPLNCWHKSRWRQAGIISYTDKCKLNVPDGYVNVAKVRDFIDSTIQTP